MITGTRSADPVRNCNGTTGASAHGSIPTSSRWRCVLRSTALCRSIQRPPIQINSKFLTHFLPLDASNPHRTCLVSCQIKPVGPPCSASDVALMLCPCPATWPNRDARAVHISAGTGKRNYMNCSCETIGINLTTSLASARSNMQLRSSTANCPSDKLTKIITPSVQQNSSLLLLRP